MPKSNIDYLFTYEREVSYHLPPHFNLPKSPCKAILIPLQSRKNPLAKEFNSIFLILCLQLTFAVSTNDLPGFTTCLISISSDIFFYCYNTHFPLKLSFFMLLFYFNRFIVFINPNQYVNICTSDS